MKVSLMLKDCASIPENHRTFPSLSGPCWTCCPAPPKCHPGSSSEGTGSRLENLLLEGTHSSRTAWAKKSNEIKAWFRGTLECIASKLASSTYPCWWPTNARLLQLMQSGTEGDQLSRLGSARIMRQDVTPKLKYKSNVVVKISYPFYYFFISFRKALKSNTLAILIRQHFFKKTEKQSRWFGTFTMSPIGIS